MKNKKDNFLIKLDSIERRAKSIMSDAQIARQAYQTCETETAYQYAMKLEDTAERLTLTALTIGSMVKTMPGTISISSPRWET